MLKKRNRRTYRASFLLTTLAAVYGCSGSGIGPRSDVQPQPAVVDSSDHFPSAMLELRAGIPNENKSEPKSEISDGVLPEALGLPEGALPLGKPANSDAITAESLLASVGTKVLTPNFSA